MLKSIIGVAVEGCFPIAFKAGAVALAKSMPEDWLEKILMKHHDEYGEFNYTECAKEIKRRIEKQAHKFGKQPNQQPRKEGD